MENAGEGDAARRAKLKEIVDARLQELRMTPSDLGEKLGRKYGYQGYFDLFGAQQSGKKSASKRRLMALTPKLFEKLEEILQLHRGHLSDLATTDQHARETREELFAFLGTDLGKSLDPDTVRTLESIRFAPPRVPSRRLFYVLAMAIQGLYSEEELGRALIMNARAAADAPASPGVRSGKVLRKPTKR